MKKFLIILGVVAVLAFVIGSSLVGGRNRLVAADENVTASWSQVENVLQRRNDLIPNLVNTVKGFAKQEKEIFVAVADARAKLAGAQTVPQKIEANQQMGGALSRLLLIVEKYPELKSNQNFMALQDELSGTENRIAVERQRYNETLRSYNVLVRSFPSNISAMIFGFQKKDAYFEAAEGATAVPAVQF